MSEPIRPPIPFLVRLRAALEQGHVLVHARGGYGKTTALRDLTRIHPQTFFFSLTPADADLAFLGGLANCV